MPIAYTMTSDSRMSWRSFADRDLAVRVVPVGNHDERLLAARPCRGERHGFGDGVVERSAARRSDRAQRPDDRASILGPALHQRRAAVEAVEEDLIRGPSRSTTNRLTAACAADIFSPAMLPLVSSASPRLTGTRSASNCETC